MLLALLIFSPVAFFVLLYQYQVHLIIVAREATAALALELSSPEPRGSLFVGRISETWRIL